MILTFCCISLCYLKSVYIVYIVISKLPAEHIAIFTYSISCMSFQMLSIFKINDFNVCMIFYESIRFYYISILQTIILVPRFFSYYK